MRLCSHVFTAAAMAACGQQGHGLLWRRVCHDLGWFECWRCGHSERYGVRPSGEPAPEASEPEAAARAPAPAAASKLGPRNPNRTWTDSATGRVYHLPERDQEIVRLRFEEHMALRAIADRFGVTEQRVSQICQQSKR